MKVAVSFIVFTLLLAAMFKILADAHLDSKQVGASAMAAALRFTIGEGLIG